jgi:hypothetical protein
VISGLYKEAFSSSREKLTKGTELELRVDVDGRRPLHVISGDFYSNLGGTREYLSSLRFGGVKKTKTHENEILLSGKEGKFNPDSEHFGNIQVRIPINSYPLEASVQWIDSFGKTSKCSCTYASKYFRSVQLEHAYEVGVAPFEPYDTADLACPSPRRSHPLGIAEVFAEAGIEMVIVEKRENSVPHPKGIPGQGSVWTDSELHDAMLEHFGGLKDVPQWTVWLLSAYEYVICTIDGIMLTHNGKKRRGCAVFQIATGWQSAEERRLRLFIYVHELGHCFNLRHPWIRSQADSSAIDVGYSTLSWMNYPWAYYVSEKSRGPEAFWKDFNFQFTESELMHLRHGFRNDVIFGGNSFSEEIDGKSPGC